MTDGVTQTVRRYTDGLFASFTKTTPDGRRVIYPWGVMGKGYFIADDQSEERLKRLYAVAVIVATVVLGVASFLGGLSGVFGALVLLLLCYVVYAKRLTAGMEPSGEGLSLVEAYRAGARAYSLRQLWSWVFTGIFMIGIGAALIVAGYPGSINPALGMLPELGIFWGLGIVVAGTGGFMLLLRRGAGPSVETPLPKKPSVIAEEIGASFTGLMGPIRAWFLTIFGLALFGPGVFLLVTDSADRSREMVGVVAVFGLVAAWGIAELVMRHRERRG